MKNKKLINLFFLLTTITLLLLPIANIFFILKGDEVNIDHFNKKHLFSTDSIEGNLNYYFYNKYKKSLNSRQVIIGKEEFLFLGNSYNNVLDKTQGNYPYTVNDIKQWVYKLHNLQNWYESKNIKFILVIAPNKHSVYNDKLPERITYKKGKTITDDILRIAGSENINILDLSDTLRKSREEHENLLYLKTDTHWNGLGASIGYEKTIKYLNNKYNMNYRTPEYSYKEVDDGGKDLASFLKITSILPKNHEKSIWFDFNEKHDVCLGDINKENHKVETCKLKGNPTYSINGKPQYTINNQALNNENVLILCDSFCMHNSQLYNASFNNIWKFHYGHINGSKLSSFVNKNKPNIVIYQVVERGLYNQGIVTLLP